MLPAKFVERVLRELGPDEGGALCRALTGEPSVSVRLNAAKGLAAPSGRPIGWSSGGYWLDARPSFTLDPDFHAGRYYVQEASSQFVGHIVAACGGIRGGRVLDLCAAPGGKTTLYSTLAGRGGLVVANEIVRNRAAVLADNVRKWGVGNVAVTVNDPSQVARLEGWFDAVAVDAPCSGEGMFRKESVAVTQYDQPLLDRCAALGAEILENAAAMLAPGGILVYSTCTFAPGEDEGQIAAFLARHPEFTLCDLSGCGFGQPGEANRTGDYPLQAEYCRRIWPCDGGEGHFMAKLQKAADAPAVELPRGKNGKGKGGKTPRVDAKALQAWQSFAKELFPTLVGQPIAVVGDGFLLEPPALLPAAKLHVLRAGVPAGRAAKGRFEPAHALFMAYGAQCTNCEELTLADPRTAAWLRGEEIEAQTAQNGWCAVLVDGFPLGGGKASGGRIKNHYPKALRNLK